MKKPVLLQSLWGEPFSPLFLSHSFPVSSLAILSGKPHVDICTDDTFNNLKCMEEADMGVYSLVQYGRDSTWSICGSVSVSSAVHERWLRPMLPTLICLASTQPRNEFAPGWFKPKPKLDALLQWTLYSATGSLYPPSLAFRKAKQPSEKEP